ncbi:MAG: cytochrome d ubiquinol oxidase subunit II [Fibrobacter sp.]|nr:cytochrome d ubiquinol oxidase subunit II [Bacteroidales bacterium]MCF0224592.1 cytochrome d ubiquinol oxidase subunit II [Fibrobacter sp.]
MTYQFLQNYWWLVVSLLGALLVFLMFVQGGNFLAAVLRTDDTRRRMMLNSTGRKWELTFTTLVTFGGAFFASFPLFYSTSFGGAYWVWIIILFTFVFQAVSYEFQNKKGNLLGAKPFQWFLAINGILGPFLVGTAVGTFFTGSAFTIDKTAIYSGNAPIISSWANDWHGLDALAQPWAVVLGVAVFLLTTMLGALYIINNVNDDKLRKSLRLVTRWVGLAFVLVFVAWLIHLLVAEGFAVDENGVVSMEPMKYLHNLLAMPIVLVVLVVGVLLVLFGWFKGAFSESVKGIWFAGTGSVLAVLAILLVAGYNGTAYYPSTADLQSSLTLTNSCSSPFTLQTMFWASLAVPFVIAYIAYAWHAMDKKEITQEEMENEEEKY